MHTHTTQSHLSMNDIFRIPLQVSREFNLHQANAAATESALREELVCFIFSLFTHTLFI